EINTCATESIVVPVAKAKTCPGTGAAIGLPVEHGRFSLRCDLREIRHDAGLPVRFYLQCPFGFCIAPEKGHGFVVKPEFFCGDALHALFPRFISSSPSGCTIRIRGRTGPCC